MGRNQDVFLENTSHDKKIKFTIKKYSKLDDGIESSSIVFFELEPGEEKRIGMVLSLSQKEFYDKTVYDTIKELTNFDKIIKPTRSSIKMDKELSNFNKSKYIYTPRYITTYQKNGRDFDPNATSDGSISPFSEPWKSIDTSRTNNIQTVTFLVKHISPDLSRPKNQIRTVYKYELKGQRLIN